MIVCWMSLDSPIRSVGRRWIHSCTREQGVLSSVLHQNIQQEIFQLPIRGVRCANKEPTFQRRDEKTTSGACAGTPAAIFLQCLGQVQAQVIPTVGVQFERHGYAFSIATSERFLQRARIITERDNARMTFVLRDAQSSSPRKFVSLIE